MKNILKKILKKIKQCIWLGVYAFMQSRRRLHPHLAPRAALLLLHQRGRGVQVHIGVGQGLAWWVPADMRTHTKTSFEKLFWRFQVAGGLFRQRRKGHDRGDKNIKSCSPPPKKNPVALFFLQKILDQPNTTFFLPLKGDGAGGDPEKIARDFKFFLNVFAIFVRNRDLKIFSGCTWWRAIRFPWLTLTSGLREWKAFLSRKISYVLLLICFNFRWWWWMETTSTSTRTFTATWRSGETTSQGF